MKILILVAMDKELELIKNILEHGEEMCVCDRPVLKGRIGDHDVFIAKCGIGKVNAAINAFILVNGLNPDMLLNSGVAGGAGIPIGTVLIADKVAYYDVWCGPGTRYGEADGAPLFFSPSQDIIGIARETIDDGMIRYGLICSGDKFISRKEEIDFIRSHFPEVSAVDMESAAIAQVCFNASTPFNIIRVVSDTPGEGENLSQYQDFWTEAPQKTFTIVSDLIRHLK